MTLPPDANADEAVLRILDLGGVQDVPVLEVLVKPGDRVEVDTPLATLESDKARRVRAALTMTPRAISTSMFGRQTRVGLGRADN